jgi:hypothetical protein
MSIKGRFAANIRRKKRTKYCCVAGAEAGATRRCMALCDPDPHQFLIPESGAGVIATQTKTDHFVCNWERKANSVFGPYDNHYLAELGTRNIFLYPILDLTILQRHYSIPILRYFSTFRGPILDTDTSDTLQKHKKT